MQRNHSKWTDFVDYPRFVLFFFFLALLAGVAWQYRDVTDAQVGLALRRDLYEITHAAKRLW